MGGFSAPRAGIKMLGIRFHVLSRNGVMRSAELRPIRNDAGVKI